MSVVGYIADIFAGFCIIDHRATGHVDVDILAVGAVTLVATAITAVFGEDMALVSQV